MTCPERLRLVLEYRDTSRQYSEAVRKMADLIGQGVGWEMDVLRRSCRNSWEGVEKSRLALARHEANHFCDRADFVSPVSGS